MAAFENRQAQEVRDSFGRQNIRYPHLTLATDGSIQIGTTRYKAIHLAAEHYQLGWSAEELLRQHPDLRPAEVYSTLAWFYDRFDEIVTEIKARSEQADAQRLPVTVSRDELLRRQAARNTYTSRGLQ